MEDRWLSVDEIAAYLGIKPDTVYKWIREKEMPARRLGRLWKFRKEEVYEWVKAGGAADASSEQAGKPSPRAGPLTREEVLRRLRERASEMSQRFSLRRIGLFGSFALESAGDRSDIDLLVEMDAPTFDSYMELKFYLEELLGRPVDLVLADNVKPRLKSRIAEQVVYA